MPLFHSQREMDDKVGARSNTTSDADMSTHPMNKLSGDRQTQTRTSIDLLCFIILLQEMPWP